jgi:gamma-glutamylcyclotransferase (GGCT)/AIG2-like uncharacterized protein YtfP
MKIFTYGTLMSSLHNHYLLEDQNFLGQARTVDRFSLLVSPSYLPYLTGRSIFGLVSEVIGEVYEVTPRCLAQLDALERHPTWYERRPLLVDINGIKTQVEAYFCDYPGQPGHLEVVPNGDYKHFLRTKAITKKRPKSYAPTLASSNT